MDQHVLYIGYRIDEPRKEAVTINASLYRDVSESLGCRCEFLTYRDALFSPIRLLAYLRKLAATVKKDSTLIVHDFFVLTGFSLMILVVLRLRTKRVRYIKTFINPPGGGNVTSTLGWLRLLLNNRLVYRLVAKRADAVTYVEPLDHPGFHCLPMPLRYKPMSRSPREGRMRVGYLGHPLRLKGVHLFPQIVSAVQGARPNLVEFHFSFSSHWPTPRRIQALGDHPACTIEGESNPDVFFGQTDVYLLPIRDGFAASGTFNTVWEAMACGCCVVTACAEHLPKLLNDESAELVSNPTAEAYASAIIRLIDDPDRLAAKQGKALEAYRGHYSDNHADLANVLKELYEQG